MIDLQTVQLIDLVPSNLRNDPKVIAAAAAIDQQMQAVTQLIPDVSILHRINELPEEWLDEMARQFHVDFYDPELPLSQRRQLVANSMAWHRRKGTPSAVEELIATIFGDGIVEEWFDYGGDPYFFRVVTSNFSATTEHAERFLRAVNSVKNTRSWLDNVLIRLVEDTPVYFGTGVYIADHLTLEQEALPE